MDFRLSSEQELLRDSARRYFAADASKRDDRMQFAELGWLAMLVPDDAGGLGAGFEDIAILCEEMGRGLTRASFIGGAVLPARILTRCAGSEQRRKMLSAITENKMRVAVAVYEPDRRYDLSPSTRAMPMPDGSYRLTGSKTLVAGGAQADQLIVSARIEKSGSGPALFVMDAARAGISRRIYQTIDGVEVADFALEQVIVSASEMLAGADAALTILEDALDEATLCLCAEELGGMDQAIQLTANYLKVRKQFGKALAEFQALQHAVAEMWIEANSARSLIYRAIATIAASRTERRKAISGCCIKVMQAAKSVSGTAVHLHGALGVTCEYPVGHYLRRVLVSERLFGDREYHLARYLAAC